MPTDHERYRFSVTCQTDDLAVLHCLRALCQHVEKFRKPQIGWGGTSEASWRGSSGEFTLRFTSAEYRSKFLSEGERLLKGHWRKLRENDNDPASPQR